MKGQQEIEIFIYTASSSRVFMLNLYIETCSKQGLITEYDNKSLLLLFVIVKRGSKDNGMQMVYCVVYSV